MNEIGNYYKLKRDMYLGGVVVYSPDDAAEVLQCIDLLPRPDGSWGRPGLRKGSIVKLLSQGGACCRILTRKDADSGRPYKDLTAYRLWITDLIPLSPLAILALASE